MGQKVNPIGLRLGINRTWDSRWFADRGYRALLSEDLKIREYLNKRLAQAGVSRIVIERPAKKARITIHTARPGVVIGKKGQEIENLRQELARRCSGDVHLNIVEVQEARDRRQARGREHRPAADPPGDLPPRHEAGGAVGDAAGGAGHPGVLRRPAGRCGDRAQRVVSRGPGAVAHACAPTSTSAAAPRTRPTAPAGSRSGCSAARSWSTTRSPTTSARPRSASRVAAEALLDHG